VTRGTPLCGILFDGGFPVAIRNKFGVEMDTERMVGQFMEMVQVDSESGDEARFMAWLKPRLEDLGATAVLDSYGNLIAKLPAKGSAAAPILLSCHGDTVKPGKGIKPALKDGVIRSAGDTILGADDKAGIAEIMSAVAYLARHPERPRAPIRVAFTVDEEVGRGAEDFDLARFGAAVAYTLDGSGLGELEIETFSAKSMRVTIHGLSVHPGSAKGKLINAVKLAAELVMSLPKDRLSPETTEGREGYVHPHRISGNAEEAIVDFIVRDHDDELLEQHMVLLRELVHEVAEREPRAHVEIEERGSYRNMHPYIEESPRVVEAALEAIRRVGVEPRLAITRGGTDGAILSAQGLPTPNLFTGGQEYHSVREWASVQDMAAAAATIVELAGVWAEPH